MPSRYTHTHDHTNTVVGRIISRFASFTCECDTAIKRELNRKIHKRKTFQLLACQYFLFVLLQQLTSAQSAFGICTVQFVLSRSPVIRVIQ